QPAQPAVDDRQNRRAHALVQLHQHEGENDRGENEVRRLHEQKGRGLPTDTLTSAGILARPRENRKAQLNRTGMITQTKLSSVLNTPGLTSSFTSKNTSSLASAFRGSIRNVGLKATCRSGPL